MKMGLCTSPGCCTRICTSPRRGPCVCTSLSIAQAFAPAPDFAQAFAQAFVRVPNVAGAVPQPQSSHEPYTSPSLCTPTRTSAAIIGPFAPLPRGGQGLGWEQLHSNQQLPVPCPSSSSSQCPSLLPLTTPNPSAPPGHAPLLCLTLHLPLHHQLQTMVVLQ